MKNLYLFTIRIEHQLTDFHNYHMIFVLYVQRILKYFSIMFINGSMGHCSPDYDLH